MKDLFGHEPKPMPRKAFDGKTYEPTRDYVRLSGQLERVFELMKDGRWRALYEIKVAIGSGSEAAVSARLRDLRKQKYGAHTVERMNIENGWFKYRLIVNQETRHDR